MPDFTNRSTEVEIMDDLTCEGEVVEQTLHELDFINKWLGGDQVTLDAVAGLLDKTPAGKKIVIVDLGCGSGTLLSKIASLLKAKKRKATLIGIDANPTIVGYARRYHPESAIEFLAIDIFSEEFSRMKFDVVIGTLFFHHFTNQQLTSFFQQVSKQTSIGIVVNDIHRHPLAYFSIKWLTALFSKSAMVKFDAPLSVLRAFKKKDWSAILGDAGLSYSLKWKWAFRWQLIIESGNLFDS
jgi:2-polyprenyl-3-methyl-5-hydroxy-6-metoxy-1,4-benzoquinol methylase